MKKTYIIESKNYEQYRFMKFQLLGREAVLVSRLDDENRRLFRSVNLSDNILAEGMMRIISNYLHKNGFEEYEKQGKILISGKINGKKYEFLSDEISYV